MFSTAVAGNNFGAAETVVCITPPLSISLPNQPVLLYWYVMFGGGATITAILFRLRRGTTTGGVFINSTSQADQTATGTNSIRSGVYVDVPGEIAGVQYCLTMTCTGNTGSQQVVDVCMIAMQL